MDYSELVKDLRYCADIGTYCSSCKYFDVNCEQKLIAKVADAIEELNLTAESYKRSMEAWAKEAANAQSRWISVAERLPEEYVNVLCHLRSLDRKSEYCSIDHLMEDGQWWKAANSLRLEVTHWMPLPEPPKEETE